MAWTDERVAELKQLWEQGHSASQIATILGEVTRNAVIGKAHRLGLSSRPSPIKAGQPGSAQRPKKKPAARRPVPRRRAAPAARAKPERPAAPKLTDAERRLLAVQPQPAPADYRGPTCQWPIGDPGQDEFRFCGAPASTGRPYCDAHCQIAYRRREEAA
ncbi:MAG: GcrA family cell cycle regulator [Alphaproteobacteria bacterium]